MLDVPAYFVDLPFEIIEDQVCPLVFLAVNVVDDVIGICLDVSNVICQCHGISLKRLARKRTRRGVTYRRAQPPCKKCKESEKVAAGMDRRALSGRQASVPAAQPSLKGKHIVGLDVTGQRKLNLASRNAKSFSKLK